MSIHARLAEEKLKIIKGQEFIIEGAKGRYKVKVNKDLKTYISNPLCPDEKLLIHISDITALKPDECKEAFGWTGKTFDGCISIGMEIYNPSHREECLMDKIVEVILGFKFSKEGILEDIDVVWISHG